MTIARIISGAQTGADRAALDAAIEAGITCGGWVPRGRLDENAVIPSAYPNLIEANSDDPNVRTELNVRDSDATLILSHGALLGGSEYTEQKARELGKPIKHLDLSAMSIDEAVALANHWIAAIKPETLNVAGPRASDDPSIYAKTKTIITRLLTRHKNP